MKLPAGVFKFTGARPGPTIGVVVGVHGNERAGIRAMDEILRRKLHVLRGVVYILYGNPRAIQRQVRFTDENLNRCFQMRTKRRASYEYKRAQELKPILRACDVVLDVHSTGIKNSKAFIIAEKNSAGITRYLPVPIICSGFDRIEPGGVDYYMNKRGKIGMCIETGYLDSRQSYRIAWKGIMDFLKVMGTLSGKVARVRQQSMCAYFLYRSKTTKFTLAHPFGNFDIVKAQEPIGYDGDELIVADKKSHIIFAHNRNKKGDECFILAEKV